VPQVHMVDILLNLNSQNEFAKCSVCDFKGHLCYLVTEIKACEFLQKGNDLSKCDLTH